MFWIVYPLCHYPQPFEAVPSRRYKQEHYRAIGAMPVCPFYRADIDVRNIPNTNGRAENRVIAEIVFVGAVLGCAIRESGEISLIGAVNHRQAARKPIYPPNADARAGASARRSLCQPMLKSRRSLNAYQVVEYCKLKIQGI